MTAKTAEPDVLETLNDPHYRRLVAEMGGTAVTVCTLGKRLDQTRASVTVNLARLKELGLVTNDPPSRWQPRSVWHITIVCRQLLAGLEEEKRRSR